jgi:hypothetical protein
LRVGAGIEPQAFSPASGDDEPSFVHCLGAIAAIVMRGIAPQLAGHRASMTIKQAGNLRGAMSAHTVRGNAVSFFLG